MPDRADIRVSSSRDALRPALGHDGSVRQVVEILLDNALRHGGADVPIEVRIDAVDATIALHVLDDGPGMPFEGLGDDMFRLFHRGARGASRVSGGTGIGLFVARAIVESLGGELWARNRTEGGADVGFCLPSAPEDELR